MPHRPSTTSHPFDATILTALFGGAVLALASLTLIGPVDLSRRALSTVGSADGKLQPRLGPPIPNYQGVTQVLVYPPMDMLAARATEDGL